MTSRGVPIFRLLKSLGRGIRAFLQAVSIPMETVIFLPGVVVVSGTKLVITRLLHLQTERLRLLESFGGTLVLNERPGPRAALTLTLIPSLVAICLGLIFLLPFIINFSLLGVTPITSLDWIVGKAPRSIDSLLPQLLAWYRIEEIVFFWIGFSCWFCAAPRAKDIRDAREYKRAGTSLGARVGDFWLDLVYAMVRIFEVFDEAMLWIGANAFLASGLATIALLLFVTRLALRIML
jgi:hypothetical protein